MEEVSGAIQSFFEVMKEIFGTILSAAPKTISFFLWALTAAFILPCVFVAGVIYPKWEKWGEGF